MALAPALATAPLALLAAVLAAPAPPAQTLPLGFTIDVMAPNLQGPIGIAFLPDGRLLFVEQHTGAVKVLASSAVGTLGTVPNLAVSYSRGLLAIAVDPRWPAWPCLYLFHSHAPAGDHRITRYTVTGALTDPQSTSLQLGAAYTVLDGIPDQRPIHDGACLRFGPDGMLYASLGDDDDACAAQDLTRLNGKILRLDVAGLPAGGGGPPPRALLAAPGNPYLGLGDVMPLVWASGLRNPFRFHVDPADGALFVADVGDLQMDEIDRVAGGGANLGWPWFEGTAPHIGCSGTAPAVLPPIATLAVGPGFTALVSLGVYRAPAGAPFRFGSAYEGSYLYAEHFTGRIWRIGRDGGGWASAAPVPGQSGPPWADGVAWITDAAVGPDGALWFAERMDVTRGSIRRIRPTGPAFATFGQGCPGSAGTPSLGAGGAAPALGGVFPLALGNLPPSGGVAVLALGLSKARWGTAPLPVGLGPFGMPGCTSHVAPDATVLLLHAGGTATWPLSLPAAAPLVGQEFFVQAVVADPGVNAAGLVVSNAGEGVLR